MSRGDFTNELVEARYLAEALVASRLAYGRDTAIKLAARAVGISKWSFWAILYGRRKSIASNTIKAIRREYLKQCEKQIARLVAETNDLRDRCGEDDFVQALGAETMRLVARLKEARRRIN